MRAHHAGPRLRAMESTPLSVSNPELAAQASGWDPTTLSAGSHRRVEWICERQHVWLARVDRRTSGGACPECTAERADRPRRTSNARTRSTPVVPPEPSAASAAATGEKPKVDKHTPRWLFLVEQRHGATLRVGTSTLSPDEYSARVGSAWDVRKARGPMSAKSATKLERRIAEMLRHRGVETLSESASDESTTSWGRDDFAVASLKKLIKLAEEK